jgi:hypothetical protein
MPALPNAEQIIERAQKGEKVTTAERRHAVAYIMGVMGTLSNREIAELFGITERVIRTDKKFLREERAAVIKEDDVGLVIADIVMTYDAQIRDIEKCKKASKVGSQIYLSCCKSIFEMQTRKVDALQALGYYPKNLGNMTVERFEYKGIVSEDGSVNTRPMTLFDAAPMPGRDLEALDAEFTDVKQIEAPQP